MRLKILILIAELLAAAVASAAAPRAEIVGPAKVRPYQGVMLDASGSVAAEDGLIWDFISHPDDGILTSEGGRKAFFVSPSGGKLVIRLLAVDLDGGKAKVASARWEIVIDGPLPPPGPDPGPGPAPDDLTGLSRDVRDWADGIPTEARRIAPELAANFESVASSIAAGVLTDPKRIIETTFAANKSTQREHAPAWAEFFQRLSVRLNELAKAGTLRTPADHQKTWGEIAAGLRRVK